MYPPLTFTTAPVINEAPSPAKKSAVSATSEGLPIRISGVSFERMFKSSSVRAEVISVSITHGAIQLTVMPEGPTSFASALVIPISAALLAE